MFKNALSNKRLLNVFILIAAAAYTLIMIRLLFLRGYARRWDIYSYNLVPFKTISHYIINIDRFNRDIWVKNLFGNIILFIPIGAFLPLLNKKFLRPVLFTVSSFFILLCVELTQMLARVGSFDVDDLILNISGALIGLAFTKLALKIMKSIPKTFT